MLGKEYQSSVKKSLKPIENSVYVPNALRYNLQFVYISEPIFHCGLYCRVVSVTDNLCTKQGNSSIFWSKIRGL